VSKLEAELAKAKADAANWKRLVEMRDGWLDTIAGALGFVGDTDELIARVKKAAAIEREARALCAEAAVMLQHVLAVADMKEFPYTAKNAIALTKRLEEAGK
jgi:hypothetical protein